MTQIPKQVIVSMALWQKVLIKALIASAFVKTVASDLETWLMDITYQTNNVAIKSTLFFFLDAL